MNNTKKEGKSPASEVPFREAKILEVPNGDDVELCSLCGHAVDPNQMSFGVDIGDLDKSVSSPVPVRARVCKACLMSPSNMHLAHRIMRMARYALQDMHSTLDSTPEGFAEEIKEGITTYMRALRHAPDPIIKELRGFIRDQLGALEIESFPECWTEECAREGTDCSLCTSPRKVQK